MKFKRLNEESVEGMWPFRDIDVEVPFTFSNIKMKKGSDGTNYSDWASMNFRGQYIRGTLVTVDEGEVSHVKATDVTIVTTKKDYDFHGFKSDSAIAKEFEALKWIVSLD